MSASSPLAHYPAAGMPVSAAASPLPRLFFVTLSLDVGGAERHLSMLLPELARRGWPVTIYCMNRLGAYADAVRAAGVEVIAPPIERKPGLQGTAGRLYATLRASARLYAAMRRAGPAVAHFFLPEAYLFGAPISLLQRVPIRIMSRRGLNLYQRNWRGAATIEHRLHRRMTALLANSRRVVADLEAEGCPQDRIGIIYNGVALSGLDAPADRRATRQRLGLVDDDLVLIVVATLIGYKGYADLLHALARVRDRLPPQVRLLCVGRDEGARASLEALTAEHGLADCVRFLGSRDDVADLLAASDVSVLPSHEEGFSNAVIEAMAAGLPLLVTDVGGNPEAVIDGETGLVVPPRSPEALGEALVKLASNAELRRRFGDAGRARANEHFTLEACVDRYERLYRGLLSGKPMRDIDLA